MYFHPSEILGVMACRCNGMCHNIWAVREEGGLSERKGREKQRKRDRDRSSTRSLGTKDAVEVRG